MRSRCHLQQCDINTEPSHGYSTAFGVARSTLLAASKRPFQVVIRAPLIKPLGLHMFLIRASKTMARRAVYKAFS